jgi:regulator of sirC expression with transglutaminase-like and TPR domain
MLARAEPLDLVEASLLVAAEEYPRLNLPTEINRLAAMGEEAARRVAQCKNPFARLDALRTYLFDELGFQGNGEQFDDPRNSYLNEVLNRRIGVPLTLSIVYLDVAKRAGLEARGVGLPGHFIVRVDEQGRSLLVDPYHAGNVVTEEDCRELVIRTTGRASLFKRDLLDGTSSRAMLVRLLLSLKRIYLAREDYARALSMVERVLMACPDDPKEIRDRGFLLAHLGRTRAAVADLEAYLALEPRAADADSVRPVTGCSSRARSSPPRPPSPGTTSPHSPTSRRRSAPRRGPFPASPASRSISPRRTSSPREMRPTCSWR